jgi:hypothetical protein
VGIIIILEPCPVDIHKSRTAIRRQWSQERLRHNSTARIPFIESFALIVLRPQKSLSVFLSPNVNKLEAASGMEKAHEKSSCGRNIFSAIEKNFFLLRESELRSCERFWRRCKRDSLRFTHSVCQRPATRTVPSKALNDETVAVRILVVCLLL